MNISSVGNNNGSFQAQATQLLAQVPKTAGDSDGDSDGSVSKAVQAATVPTVNLNNQNIGQVISTSA
jgi:hypothetical protein